MKFGLPSGEKDTPQLRNRFNNYVKDMKKQGMWGSGTHEKHLHAQNSFYQFNKDKYDTHKSSKSKALNKLKK